MTSKIRKMVVAAGLLLAVASLVPTAHADDSKATVRAGYLTCHVSSGWGFIFGSSRSMKCSYAMQSNYTEYYTGSITKFGADIGYLQSGVILWTVLSPGTKITTNPGLLSGHYGGATASATVGLGIGGNLLVGGMDGSISLQPLSIEGNTGLNVAAGVAMMDLKFESVAGINK